MARTRLAIFWAIFLVLALGFTTSAKADMSPKMFNAIMNECKDVAHSGMSLQIANQQSIDRELIRPHYIKKHGEMGDALVDYAYTKPLFSNKYLREKMIDEFHKDVLNECLTIHIQVYLEG